MKIKYLDCNGKKKLFSFHIHDFRTWEDEEGNYYMIDGGFQEYFRYSHPDMTNKEIIKEEEVSDVIADIREQFVWGRNYDKNKNVLPKTEWLKLKNISNDHLIGIIEFLDAKKDTLQFCIFQNEIKYRLKNKIHVNDYKS